MSTSSYNPLSVFADVALVDADLDRGHIELASAQDHDAYRAFICAYSVSTHRPVLKAVEAISPSGQQDPYEEDEVTYQDCYGRPLFLDNPPKTHTLADDRIPKADLTTARRLKQTKQVQAKRAAKGPAANAGRSLKGGRTQAARPRPPAPKRRNSPLTQEITEDLVSPTSADSSAFPGQVISSPDEVRSPATPPTSDEAGSSGNASEGMPRKSGRKVQHSRKRKESDESDGFVLDEPTTKRRRAAKIAGPVKSKTVVAK